MTPRPDVPSTLRDQIAEALYRHTMDHAAGGPARLLTRDETVLWENSLARADVVMHVIEHDILAAEVDATQRADELAARLQEAERQRDEALAAVQRVRKEVDDLMQCQDSLDPSERMRCAMCGGDHLAGIAAALKPEETS